MEASNSPKLSQYPEWDLRLKTIDLRFEMHQKMQVESSRRPSYVGLKTFYWVGHIDLWNPNPYLYFTNRKNAQILDQYVVRDANLKKINTLPIVYDLDPIFLLVKENTFDSQPRWLHCLVEEIIFQNGKHCVRVIMSDLDKSFGHNSKVLELDAKAKEKMKEIFKTGLEPHHKITVLSEEEYPTQELNLGIVAA
jgi:hypothetical protein